MASVASAGASPLSGYEMLAHQSTSGGDSSNGDSTDAESWQFIEFGGAGAGAASGSGPGSSVAFYSASPVSAASFGSSYAVVHRHAAQAVQQGHSQVATPQRHLTASPIAAVSPMFLDLETGALSPAPQAQYPMSAGAAATTPGAGVLSLPDPALGQPMDPFGVASTAGFMPGLDAPDTSFLTTGNMGLYTQEQINDPAPFFNSFMPQMPTVLGLETLDANMQPQPSPVDLGIPEAFPSPADVGSWDQASFKREDGGANPFVLEEFFSTSPSYESRSMSTSNQSSVGGPHSPANMASLSPKSPSIKQETEARANDSAIRKIKGPNKVEKKKAVEPASKFVIMTPNIINAQAGKPNPFECFDAMRTTSRGRKGPLANETKENALQVRRLGACFCCHSRKVKCDKERPCRNCKKLMVAVPQIVCWQFQDFLTVLFPDFIRGHFRKDEMQRFVTENIESFRVDGVEKPCTVELFSGARFSAIMTVTAKFFTAKTPEVLQHWHLQVGGNEMDLQSRGAAPIGIDLDSAIQRDELRRRAKDYIHNIITEPFYAEQVTDAFRHTDLPRKVVKIVQNFAICSDSPIVKRALNIYAMHYVMTRHLCLTRQSIFDLQQTGQVPQNVPWVTPRVLNRQIKSIVDELLMREMQQLFENFSKSLKPKSRREWAPCLAAFLLLCLFMEALETAADNFVVSQNEINVRNRYAPEYKRDFAIKLNREVENMPFKQFAYQFHQIYQTHSRDANSKAFNPLLDEAFMDQGYLDGPAVVMVSGLKELIQGPGWAELDFLTMDPVPAGAEGEDHPYPRDVSLNYTGRLVAKFLLSFTDEKYIFDAQS